MGAWIETKRVNVDVMYAKVAPFMGAWIETTTDPLRYIAESGRTLHGCVD